jgi:hypothetical protein
MNRTLARFESRFQRSCMCSSGSWADAPGYDDGALSALEANASCVGRDLLSANGAAFNDSLGQRPRPLIHSRSLALKARFTPGVCR